MIRFHHQTYNPSVIGDGPEGAAVLVGEVTGGEGGGGEVDVGLGEKVVTTEDDDTEGTGSTLRGAMGATGAIKEEVAGVKDEGLGAGTNDDDDAIALDVKTGEGANDEGTSDDVCAGEGATKDEVTGAGTKVDEGTATDVEDGTTGVGTAEDETTV